VEHQPLGDNKMAEHKGKAKKHHWEDLGLSAFSVICVFPQHF